MNNRYKYYKLRPNGYGVWDTQKFMFIEFYNDPVKVVLRVQELNGGKAA